MHSTKEVALESGMELAPDRSLPEVIHPQYVQYKIPEKRIAGLRRETFWLLVALSTVVALALGLGTGLGLGLRNNNGNNTGAEAESASISNGNTVSLSVATSTSAPVATESVATATSTGSTSSTKTTSIAASTITPLVDSGCPGINGTTTTISTMSYRLYCNSDLTGTNQASLVTNSLNECVTLCDSLNWTQNRRDVGSVWNEKGVIGQTAGTCWCKGGNSIQVISHTGIVVARALAS
ncbi:hypothetical protein F4781DRAFT_420677 [Annulohypoxylon bovei var. microspora]|nr:hypothetical protein F4781DRAFT_420677 [Annulohypoxylon bovei var. microspora]